MKKVVVLLLVLSTLFMSVACTSEFNVSVNGKSSSYYGHLGVTVTKEDGIVTDVVYDKGKEPKYLNNSKTADIIYDISGNEISRLENAGYLVPVDLEVSPEIFDIAMGRLSKEFQKVFNNTTFSYGIKPNNPDYLLATDEVHIACETEGTLENAFYNKYKLLIQELAEVKLSADDLKWLDSHGEVIVNEAILATKNTKVSLGNKYWEELEDKPEVWSVLISSLHMN